VGRVDQVVQRADRRLEKHHRDAEPERGLPCPAGRERSTAGHQTVEQGRERMRDPQMSDKHREQAHRDGSGAT
jgi:hypothetical protein